MKTNILGILILSLFLSIPGGVLHAEDSTHCAETVLGLGRVQSLSELISKGYEANAFVKEINGTKRSVVFIQKPSDKDNDDLNAEARAMGIPFPHEEGVANLKHNNQERMFPTSESHLDATYELGVLSPDQANARKGSIIGVSVDELICWAGAFCIPAVMIAAQVFDARHELTMGRILNPETTFTFLDLFLTENEKSCQKWLEFVLWGFNRCAGRIWDFINQIEKT